VNNLVRTALVALVAASTVAAAQAAPKKGPFDAKAREIFEKVISIPSSAGNRKVPELAEYLAGEFRAVGFPAEDVRVISHKLPFEETASLVVRYRGDGSGGKPILLLAHMDVVVAKREDWQRDPFKLIEENGMFFGRGTADNKTGVTMLTTTFLRLKSEKWVPKRDLIIYFSGDEETAQATTISVARNHRDLIDAEYALNSDAGGGNFDDTTGKPVLFGVQTAEKTYADYVLTVKNAGGHSSQPRADNAIYELSTALVKLRQYSFPVMWNETTIASLGAAARNTPGELGTAMAEFSKDPKNEAAAARLAASPSHVGQTRTTCVPTMLNGGHAANALPQSASATVNCRIFPGVKPEAVREVIAQVVGEGVNVAFAQEAMSSDASPLRKDVIDAVTRAVHKIHPGVPVVPEQSSGATDGLVFRSIGIPTYGMDTIFMKPKDQFSHGLNERVPVQSFYDGLEIWYGVLKDLAGKRAR
jgi:acetylornithine deacetylase/succinyl-diaminopimelate desuccinylase-like protein